MPSHSCIFVYVLRAPEIYSLQISHTQKQMSFQQVLREASDSDSKNTVQVWKELGISRAGNPDGPES